jgi:eukaryotic-like serine/threonine-protein kinase
VDHGTPGHRAAADADPDQLELVEVLGEGTFGIVHRAIHRPTGRQVALKVLRHPHPNALTRFKREFRALADVHHPNLVSLHGLLKKGDEWMYSMEYVDGVDLLRWIRMGHRAFTANDEHPAPASVHERHQRIRAALAQVVDGLRALHAHGHLHRDLKPSNILVTREGRVVVLDFSLVDELHPLPRQRVADPAGSPAYMSPEQTAGATGGEASDWYGLGVILYQALTARLPFEGTSPSIIVQKQTSDPPDVRLLAPDVPEDLATLCMALLSRRPDARPGADAIRACLTGTQGPDAGREAEAGAPFVGRARELEVLDEALRCVRDEWQPVLVRLHGRSGMGKTTLLHRFVRRISSRRPVILAGRCYEQEAVPYKGIDGVVDALVAYLQAVTADERERLMGTDLRLLARIFPVVAEVTGDGDAWVGPPDPHELRRAAFAALAGLLRRLTERRPVVIAIDDAHWGDGDSAHVLRELMSASPPLPVLWILAYRDDLTEQAPWMRGLEASFAPSVLSVRDVPLQPLDADEARAVALARLGTTEAGGVRAAEAIAQESAGLPLFITQLVEHARAAGNTSGVSLGEALRWRVHHLSPPARSLLQAVCIFGRPVDRALAARAADVSEDAPSALAELRAARLLRVTREADGTMPTEPYHGRVREVVLDATPPDRRRLLHGRWAQALGRDGGADPEELAVHLRGAGHLDAATRALVAAADQAMGSLAWNRAARLYRQALELSADPPMAALVGRARALANAGRGAEAAEAYLAAAERCRGDDAVDLEREAAEQLLCSGRMDEGFDLLARVLGTMDLAWPRHPLRTVASLLAERTRLRMHDTALDSRPHPPAAGAGAQPPPSPRALRRIDACFSAGMGMGGVDSLRGAYFQSLALRLALEAGDPFRIARSVAFEAAFESNRGSPNHARAEALLERTRAMANALDDPYLSALGDAAEAVAAFHLGHWTTALERAQRAEDSLRSRCTGVSKERVTVRLFALASLAQLGRFDTLAAQVRSGLEDSRRRGDLYASINLRTGLPSLWWLAADAPDEAERLASAAMEAWRCRTFLLPDFFHLQARVEIDLYRGEGASALRRLHAARPALRRSLLMRIQVVRVLHRDLHGRALLSVAHAPEGTARHLRLARKEAWRLLREDAAWSRPLGERLMAGVAMLEGRRTDAAVHLEAAALQFRDLDMAAHAATAAAALARIHPERHGAPTAASLEALRALGVRAPARFARLHLPALDALLQGATGDA